MSERDSQCVVEAGAHEVTVSHPDKLLFPDDGITKYQLVDYYARIAPTALRHYEGRALSMHRFPDGIAEDGFFQKQIGPHFPDWVHRVTLPKEGGEVDYVVADDAATLVYLAQQACITPHLSLARADRPQHPDRMIFDLDPADDDFSKVRRAAMHLKRMLERLSLPVFVQTTGSRGLHLIVPLDRGADFTAVRDFSHALCERVSEEDPQLMTIEQRKNNRGNRVFLDDMRNAYGQTAVAPYAVRALPGAPIATPLRWAELDGELGPRAYSIGNIFRRMAQIEDPWHDIARHASRLPRTADIP